jgi:cyclopropane fatty-acyl-phospholipid synthase-like methyltransferase
MVPVMGFEWAYVNGRAPWDIGRPQPVLVRLAEQGLIAGTVIDVGCGTGENVLHLASIGLEAAGIDLAPTAIARARAKATARGLRATFEVADALDLGTQGRTYDVAVDFGLFHVFTDAERVMYERSLRTGLRPGARYFFMCFSDREPGEMGPRRIGEAEIRATFTNGWRVDSIVAEHFAIRDGSGFSSPPRAWLASLTRLRDGEAAR